jgi:hypothetical protein
MARRIISFIVASIVLVTAGYQLAWHKSDLDELGGIGGLIGAIALVVLGLLAVFWPDSWDANIRKIVTLGALVSFFGSEFIKNAFSDAPGWTLVWLVVGIVAYVGLLLATTLPTAREGGRWLGVGLFDRVINRAHARRTTARTRTAAATPVMVDPDLT